MTILIIVGVVVVAVGIFLSWTVTPRGRGWNSTHNRSLEKTAPVSTGQQRYNAVAAGVFGPLVIIAGIVVIVLGATRN